MTPPNLLQRRDAIRGLACAERPGVVLDFDGTLAEMAPNPEDTKIHPRADAVLRRMVADGAYPLVALLSGRAVRDLAGKVGIGGLVYAGNHGAEYVVNGRYRVAPDAVGNADAVTAIVAHLRRTVDVPGLYYEDKGFAAAVHFRDAPEPAAAERRLLAALRSAPSMESFDSFVGRMLVEIRPKRALNKGDALAWLVAEYRLDALLFVGDDTTDVDGMRSMAELPVATAVGVAVVSPETPPALTAAADYSLSTVTEVARLLELLHESRP